MYEIRFRDLGRNEKFKLTNEPNSIICKKLKFPVIDCITFLHIIDRWKNGDKFDDNLLFNTNDPFTAIDSNGELLRIPDSALVINVNNGKK